jgi:ABC-2 type transport system permease protein
MYKTSYFALLGARVRMLLQYRAAALAGLGTQIFFGLVRVMIFEALYAGVSTEQPIALPDTITYVWLGQAFFALLPWTIDKEVALLVKTGNVAYELLRPIDLYGAWYARNLASRVAPTLLRAVPLLAVALAALGMRPPPSLAAFGAFAATMTAAVLLVGAITTLITISLLWTVGDGIYRLVGAVVLLACGLIIPLPLMPDWAFQLFAFLPFSDVADKPFRLYTGQLPAGELGAVLVHQLAWTAALVGAGRLVLARGLRRVVVAGG